MKRKMSGVSESNNLNAKIEQINKLIDSYENQIGLPSFTVENNVDKYINLTSVELGQLSADECGYAAYSLTSFAYHVQKMYNKETSIAKWAESQLPIVIASRIQQYQAPSFEERKMLCIKDNEDAFSLYKLMNYSKHRAERLAFLSQKIQNISDRLIDVQISKRRPTNG